MKSNSNEAETPGVEAPPIEIPSVETIEKWITKDLQMCVNFLTAVLQDADLRQQMAVWFHGRYGNHVNRPKDHPNGSPN